MPVFEQIKDWWLYLSYCFPREYTLEVCKAHWTWVAFSAFVLAGSIIAFVLLSVLREYMKFRRNRLRLEARAVVAPAADIVAATWTGDALHGDPDKLGSTELAGTVRAALETRKAESENSKPGPAKK